MAFQVELLARNGEFQNAIKRRLGNKFWIEQANEVFFDGEFLDAAALQFDDDDELLDPTDGDAKLGIFQFGEGFRERIDSDAKALFFETVAQFMKIENAAVHRASTALRRIETRPEPFEIRCVTAVDRNLEKAGGGKLHGMFGAALDGFRKFFRGELAEGEIDSCQMLAEEGVELRIVGGAVLQAEPPTPIATLCSQKRFMSVA